MWKLAQLKIQRWVVPNQTRSWLVAIGVWVIWLQNGWYVILLCLCGVSFWSLQYKLASKLSVDSIAYIFSCGKKKQTSPVLPRNSLSWENEKVSFFRRSQRLLHGGRGDNRPPPFLIPSSFPVFLPCIFFLSLPLSLFSRYFCLSAAFVYIGKFGNVCLVIFPLSVWFCLSFL